MPKVSVIIPVYNVEKFLPQCLDSIINQTLADIEIICINDGSTDSSLAILEKYAKNDKRVKIVNQSNKGLGEARNSGMKIATGDYIGFVDSDDWVDLKFFETLYIAAISKNADMERTCYDYNYSDMVEEEKHFNDIVRAAAEKNRDLKINEHSVVIWNAIYKSEFLKQHDIFFYDKLFGVEDVCFSAKATFLSKKTVPVTGTAYHYRREVENALSLMSLRKIFAVATANRYVIDFLNGIECTKEDYIEAYHRIIWRYDSIFKSGIKDVPEFNDKKQKEYLHSFSKGLNDFKYKNEYECLYDIAGASLIKERKFNKYVNLIQNKGNTKITYTFAQRLFSVKNDDKHKVITVMGIKFKFIPKKKFNSGV